MDISLMCTALHVVLSVRLSCSFVSGQTLSLVLDQLQSPHPSHTHSPALPLCAEQWAGLGKAGVTSEWVLAGFASWGGGTLVYWGGQCVEEREGHCCLLQLPGSPRRLSSCVVKPAPHYFGIWYLSSVLSPSWCASIYCFLLELFKWHVPRDSVCIWGQCRNWNEGLAECHEPSLSFVVSHMHRLATSDGAEEFRSYEMFIVINCIYRCFQERNGEFMV